MQTPRRLTWWWCVVVGGSGVVVACGGGGSKMPRDGGPDLGPPADAPGVPDAPVQNDLAPPPVDVMPDRMPDLMPDLGIPCGDGGECSGPLSCCSSFCVDTKKDPRHCAGCGMACGAPRFCTGTACNETVFAGVCDNPNVVVIKDPFDSDNTAAARIGAALMTACMPAPTVTEKDQTAVGVLDPDGRPLAGGSTSYISGGGAFGQDLIEYLDKAGVTPIYLTGDGAQYTFRSRQTGQDVVAAPVGTLSDGHDFFLVQLVVEPISGTLSIETMGMLAPGTVAGGFWVASDMVPKRAMYPDTWYLFEWTDSGDKVPDATDTFRMVSHGR